MENSTNQALRDLGIFYCGVYLVSLVAGALALWLYWDAWRLGDLIQVLADVTTVSAGTALLATILKEAVWFMVLAAMKIREWQDQARKEGQKQGRENQIERHKEAVARFGVEVDGVVMLPQTPEVQRFLAGEDEPESKQ